MKTSFISMFLYNQMIIGFLVFCGYHIGKIAMFVGCLSSLIHLVPRLSRVRGKELAACVLAHVYVYSILQIPHGILLFKGRFDNFWILKI